MPTSTNPLQQPFIPGGYSTAPAFPKTGPVSLRALGQLGQAADRITLRSALAKTAKKPLRLLGSLGLGGIAAALAKNRFTLPVAAVIGAGVVLANLLKHATNYKWKNQMPGSAKAAAFQQAFMPSNLTKNLLLAGVGILAERLYAKYQGKPHSMGKSLKFAALTFPLFMALDAFSGVRKFKQAQRAQQTAATPGFNFNA